MGLNSLKLLSGLINAQEPSKQVGSDWQVRTATQNQEGSTEAASTQAAASKQD